MGAFPQCRIKLPPHFVRGMIPQATHIQGQLSQRIEPLDFRWKKIVNGVDGTGLLTHILSWQLIAAQRFKSASFAGAGSFFTRRIEHGI